MFASKKALTQGGRTDCLTAAAVKPQATLRAGPCTLWPARSSAQIPAHLPSLCAHMHHPQQQSLEYALGQHLLRSIPCVGSSP